MKRRLPRERQPWRRWFIFDQRGDPTGWACGTTADAAIHQWINTPSEGLTREEISERWKLHEDAGYTVRAVDMILADTTPKDTP
jgi:hypothetical protein